MNNLKVTYKFIKTTPLKMRAVGRLVVGKPLSQAIELLTLVQKRAGRILLGYLRALEDVVNQKNLVPSDMRILSVSVQKGPVLKRWLPRSRGRVSKFQRKTCHLVVELAEITSKVKTPNKNVSLDTKAKSRLSKTFAVKTKQIKK